MEIYVPFRKDNLDIYLSQKLLLRNIKYSVFYSEIIKFIRIQGFLYPKTSCFGKNRTFT